MGLINYGGGSSGGSSQWTTSGSNIFNNNVGSVIMSAAGDGSNPMTTVQSNAVIIGGGTTAGKLIVNDADDTFSFTSLQALNTDSLPTLLIGQDGNIGQIKIVVYDGAAYQYFKHLGSSLKSSVKFDLSAIAAGSANLVITATNATPATTYSSHIASTDPAGYVQISVGGNARYIPFFT